MAIGRGTVEEVELLYAMGSVVYHVQWWSSGEAMTVEREADAAGPVPIPRKKKSGPE